MRMRFTKSNINKLLNYKREKRIGREFRLSKGSKRKTKTRLR